MKTKILNALKTEYAKMGLGDKAFDGVASFLAKTVTNEEEIEGVIKSEDTKNLLKAFQGESDHLRNRNAQLQRDFDAYKQSHPDKTDSPATSLQDDETTRTLLKKIDDLTARIDMQDAAAKQKATLASITSALKAKGCSNDEILNLTLKGFALGENETEDAAVARVKAEYDASAKKIYGDGVVPQFGSGTHADDEKALKARFAAFADSKGLGEKKD